MNQMDIYNGEAVGIEKLGNDEEMKVNEEGVEDEKGDEEGGEDEDKKVTEEEDEDIKIFYGGCEGPNSTYIKLISCDDHEFIIKRKDAFASNLIQAMMSENGEAMAALPSMGRDPKYGKRRRPLLVKSTIIGVSVLYSFLYVMNLINSPYEANVRDLLKTLSPEDIRCLAQTSTGNRLPPKSSHDAINIILIYTSDLKRLFSYRRLTAQNLFNYLYKNQVPSMPFAKKMELSDEFIQKFCKWYFRMINRLQPECFHLPGDTFRGDIFYDNSYTDIYLIGQSNSERHAFGGGNTFQLLKQTFQEYKIQFSPNLENGIQAYQSNFGMVKISCCGTIHIRNSCVGIFEQEMGMVCSPNDHVWKIMYIKINLKHASTHKPPSLPPSLPPCQVFEIKI
ncbi:uncharacterized protein C3orf38 homolog [Procambarus clarkii]|uniref:uncharacterized protein C3orf38 homolog n=1 Tax=Procambarus clarkii TaxID=6728 RepID=UPI0037435FC5